METKAIRTTKVFAIAGLDGRAMGNNCLFNHLQFGLDVNN